MSHDYHETLPGYDPEQILHDGCGECEARSRTTHRGITSLDGERFARAWHRAWLLNTQGLPNLSHAEEPMLSALWAVQLQFERNGIPIGTCLALPP